MTNKDLEIALELKQRLSNVVRMIDFKVFGSRARGEADAYSDMDVFIEVEVVNRDVKDRIRDIAWEVGFKHLIHVSPVIFTRHDLEETPLRSSPLVRNIAEEGVAL